MKKINLNYSFCLVALLALAAMSRLAPHPPNFAPMTAIAIAGSTALGFRKGAVLSLLTIWFSDFLVNNTLYASYFEGIAWFYDGWYWQYGGWLLIALMSSVSLKNISIINWLITTLGSSLLFFLVSNFGVWFGGTMYPPGFSGLIAAYTAGLPFLKNTIAADLVYSGVLVGAITLAMEQLLLKRKRN